MEQHADCRQIELTAFEYIGSCRSVHCSAMVSLHDICTIIFASAEYMRVGAGSSLKERGAGRGPDPGGDRALPTAGEGHAAVLPGLASERTSPSRMA
jgi:hypothetical protein